MKLQQVLIAIVGWMSPLLAGWLPGEIHEVRAYVYDYSQEEDNVSLLREGKLHSGIINDGGAKLTDAQVERLKAALRSRKERVPGAFCYMPHHGFVFFGREGKPMGHIELCFQCGNVASSPPGLPERQWDCDAIRKLLEELEIPILEEDSDYKKLYEARRDRD